MGQILQMHKPRGFADLSPRSGLRLGMTILFAALGLAPARYAAGAGPISTAPSTSLGAWLRASFTVDSTADAVDANPGDGLCATAGGDCTLRAAIQETNALPGDDTINLPAGAYLLTIAGANEDAGATGDLDIRDNLTILGDGTMTTTVDGNGSTLHDRAFHLRGSITVGISGLTVTGGEAGQFGGGLYNSSGRVTIQNSRIVDNVAASYGGGVYNETGKVIIENSRIEDNFALQRGGGAYNSAGRMMIVSSLFAGNTGALSGGGAETQGTLAVIDSIFSGNTGFTGGGLLSSGTTTITDSLFQGNQRGASLDVGSGTTHVNRTTFRANLDGGILNSGNLIMAESVVDGNSINGTGGGILNEGVLLLSNSTISGNTATGGGGGITTATRTSLANVTITQNQADSDNNGTGGGGGLRVNGSPPVLVKNIILAGNLGPAGAPDCSGIVISEGYNLVGEDTGCTFMATTGDQIGSGGSPIDPLLGPLQDNGGPTFTHALLPGSPAIDMGNLAGCTDFAGTLLVIDQRGFMRPVDGDGNGSAICDIGAYELE